MAYFRIGCKGSGGTLSTVLNSLGDAPGVDQTNITMFTASQTGTCTFLAGVSPIPGVTSLTCTFTFKKNGTTIGTVTGIGGLIKEISVTSGETFTYTLTGAGNKRPELAVLLCK